MPVIDPAVGKHREPTHCHTQQASLSAQQRAPCLPQHLRQLSGINTELPRPAFSPAADLMQVVSPISTRTTAQPAELHASPSITIKCPATTRSTPASSSVTPICPAPVGYFLYQDIYQLLSSYKNHPCQPNHPLHLPYSWLVHHQVCQGLQEALCGSPSCPSPTKSTRCMPMHSHQMITIHLLPWLIY